MTDDDRPPEERGHETVEASDHGDEAEAPESSTVPTSRNERGRDELLTEVRTLDARLRWKWALRATIVAAVLGVVGGAISVIVLEWGVLPGIGLFALALAIGGGHALLLFRSWQYEVREDALYLERGVFTHVKTVVPFVRVQHIDTNRDPIDRVLGLSSLVVYTAGSRGADVTIPGLRSADAADLQERLKVLANETTGDDAV